MARPIEQVLTEYVAAGTPAVALRTSEESRAIETLRTVARDLKRNLNVWTAREGIVGTKLDFNKFMAAELGPKDAVQFPALAAAAVLGWIADHIQTDEQGQQFMPDEFTVGILVMCDVQTWLKDLDPASERTLRDLVAQANSGGCTVIFLGNTFTPPPSFARYVTVIDYSLPDREALDAILAKLEADCKSQNIKLAPLDNGQREAVLRAATGLTCHETEQALALAVARARNPKTPGAVRTLDPLVISKEKALAIKRTGHLEIIEADPRGLDAVGGLGELKGWLGERRLAYSRKAREYGLPSPKGALVVGHPGTGKSLVAKCISAVFGIPTLRLDLGKLFGSLVGESEARTDEVLAMVDAVAPCVLWLDELEKALAGTHGGASHDSGVGARILGKLLYWMQERQSDVFILATCNEPWLLPAPVTRRGRFDEVWFVDLPTADECTEIAAVHVKKLGRDPKKFNLAELGNIAAAKKFTGSEIEEVVKAALYRAFYDGEREPVTQDLLDCVATTRTMAETMAEQFKRMTEYCARFRKASLPPDSPVAAKPGQRKIR